MAAEKKSFINVDELMPQVSLEQVAAFYGVTLPELKRLGAETRARCFLNCGRTGETGDRVLAIQADHPARQWHCHQYGCGKSGNLVSLCDLLKPGTPSGGRPRGDRFKEIATDLRQMVEGVVRGAPVPVTPAQPEEKARPPHNVPLKESPNDRARLLTELDRKFVTDVAALPPKASAYVRRRPFLTSEVWHRWRAGYLPRDAGGEDKSGGTMRGKIVYAYLSEEGEVLTWFGRDPEFEEKHAEWEKRGKTEREPEKFHFVKGFHRGLELFGQHRLRAPEHAEKLRQLGLIIVEGSNGVIRLDTLGAPAVGLCSNTITREQVEKTARLAQELAGGVVTLMLDTDEEGEKGARQCLEKLAEVIAVRYGWSAEMFGGTFKGRQPESLTVEEWAEIEGYLVRGEPRGSTSGSVKLG